MRINCVRDEGRPLGAGLQGQAPNHLKLLWSNAGVVNVKGKGAENRVRYGLGRLTIEPLMTCRNVDKRRRNRGRECVPGQTQEEPGYCLGGVRHKGGVNLIRALVRNVGTCRLDAKGEIQAEDPRE